MANQDAPMHDGDPRLVLAEYNRIVGVDGPEADYWHSGGGIFLIRTPLGNGYTLQWGTENENWGADLYDPTGEYIRSTEIPLPSDYADATRVACLMYDTLCAFIDGELE